MKNFEIIISVKTVKEKEDLRKELKQLFQYAKIKVTHITIKEEK